MRNKKLILLMIVALLSAGKWMLDKQKSKNSKGISPPKQVSKKIEAPQEKQADDTAGKYETNTPIADAPPVKEVEVRTKKVVNPQTALLKECPSVRLFKEEDILEEEIFASNTHFKKNGEIYRLRVFSEDSGNGSFKKLIYYKEDDSGFAEVVETPKDKSTNPTEEYIESFFENGEIIQETADIHLELRDGRTITLTEENGEFTKYKSSKENCFYEK